jgi:hypothetical protein
VFDDFELSGQGSWKLYRRVQDGADAVRWLAAEQLSAARHEAALARRHIAALSAQADALQNALDQARGQAEEQAAQAHRWWQMADGLKHELAEIRSSRGWKWFSIVANTLRRPALAVAAAPAAAHGAQAAALHAAPVMKLSPGAARHYRQLTRALHKRES